MLILYTTWSALTTYLHGVPGATQPSNNALRILAVSTKKISAVVCVCVRVHVGVLARATVVQRCCCCIVRLVENCQILTNSSFTVGCRVLLQQQFCLQWDRFTRTRVDVLQYNRIRRDGVLALLRKSQKYQVTPAAVPRRLRKITHLLDRFFIFTARLDRKV